MAAPTDFQLSQPDVRIAVLIYLDIKDDPLYFACAPFSIQTPPAASTILPEADPDFDGKLFDAVDPTLIRINPVTHAVGGSDSFSFTVSGSLEFDSEMLTALSDPSKFFGRVVRLWLVRFNEDWQPTNARPYYTGYMSVPTIGMSATEQTITMTTENYLTVLGSGSPARTILSQSLFDPDDKSAVAITSASRSHDALGSAGLQKISDARAVATGGYVRVR